MPIIAVQAVTAIGDIPVATALTLFSQQLGGTILLAGAQAVLLNILLPTMQAINPSITKDNIVAAGATGLKSLVSGSDLATTLIAYAKGLDRAFLIPLVGGALAMLFAFGVEWRNIKREKVEIVKTS